MTDTITGTITETETIVGTILQTCAVPNFKITAFSPDVLAVEAGQSIVNPIFTANYNLTPLTVTVEDNDGNLTVDVSVTPNAFTMPYTYGPKNIDETVEFDMVATTAIGDSDTEQAQIIWRPRTYWGRDVAGQTGGAFIQGLEFSAVSPSLALTLDMTGANAVGAGNKLYWAGPNDLGSPTFLHVQSGFQGGMFLVGTYNIGGVDYDLFESDNEGIGGVTLQVS